MNWLNYKKNLQYSSELSHFVAICDQFEMMQWFISKSLSMDEVAIYLNRPSDLRSSIARF